jgi:hypothetical protein
MAEIEYFLLTKTKVLQPRDAPGTRVKAATTKVPKAD